MIVLSNFAANLAQKEDAVTNYASLAQSEAQLGLALSAKENISTQRQWKISTLRPLLRSLACKGWCSPAGPELGRTAPPSQRGWPGYKVTFC